MAAEAAVLLQGVGQFVEDDDSPPVAHSLRQHLERLLPIARLDGHIALAAMLPGVDGPTQVAEQQVAGVAFGHPVEGGQAGLPGPMGD